MQVKKNSSLRGSRLALILIGPVLWLAVLGWPAVAHSQQETRWPTHYVIVVRNTSLRVQGVELIKDNTHPLCHFQRTLATKQDTQILFRTINNTLAELDDQPLSDVLLNQRFNESWTNIERQLSQLASANLPGYSAHRRSLELTENISEAVHVITASPVLAGNVCFQKLVANAVDEMTGRVKQFSERDPVLQLSVADFVCYLRNLCIEQNISIKVFSILNEQDGSPPPMQVGSI